MKTAAGWSTKRFAFVGVGGRLWGSLLCLLGRRLPIIFLDLAVSMMLVSPSSFKRETGPPTCTRKRTYINVNCLT